MSEDAQNDDSAEELNLQYELASAGPDLDRVEAALRAAGQNRVADDLLKIQQDNGLDATAGSASPHDGPQTEALIRQYQGHTCSVLLTSCAHAMTRWPILN